jgi:signal transduction histidine kinase
MAAFGAGAALVSAALALITFAVARHDLLTQRQSSSLRQAFVDARLIRQELEAPSADLADVLSSLSTTDGVRSLVFRRGLWFSTAVSVGRQSIPTSLSTPVLGGSVATQRLVLNGYPAFAVGIPIPSIGVDYFEVHSLVELQSTLGTLAIVLLVTAIATSVGGAVIGLWASRRVVRPLAEIAQVATEITEGALDRRLPADPDLGTLVGSFNGMVTSLQDRIERDSRFAADLSHELRSPLTTLDASVELVEAYRDGLPREGQWAIDVLKFETKRFSGMVQDLLEISRIDAGAADLTLEDFPIDELVRHVVASHDSAIPIHIAPSASDLVVKGDKRRLQRALANLLDNAEAHGGGPVLVALEGRGSWVEVAVVDRGPGVVASEQERIFERFYRGAASGRRGSTSGTGLGLALVAEHARVHHGAVRIESPAEGGARFIIVLPVVER